MKFPILAGRCSRADATGRRQGARSSWRMSPNFSAAAPPRTKLKNASICVERSSAKGGCSPQSWKSPTPIRKSTPRRPAQFFVQRRSTANPTALARLFRSVKVPLRLPPNGHPQIMGAKPPN